MSSVTQSQILTENPCREAAMVRAIGSVRNEQSRLIFEQMRDSDSRQEEKYKRQKLDVNGGFYVPSGPLPMGTKFNASLCNKIAPLPYVSLSTRDMMTKSVMECLPTVDSARMRTWESFEVEYVHYMGGESLGKKIIADSMLAFISVFYKGHDGGVRSKPRDYIAAYATLFATFSLDVNVESMNTTLRGTGYTLVPTVVRNESEFLKAVMRIFPHFDDTFAMFNSSDSFTRPHLLALMTVLMQTIARQASEQGLEKWFANRYKSASSVMGIGTAHTYWSSNPPKLEALNEANNIMSSSFEYRKYIFKAMVGCVKQQTEFGKACVHIVQLLMYAECSYIVNIDRFLMRQYSEILTTKAMAGEEEILANAYGFLESLGAQAPFVKLLYPQSQCKAIHRDLLQRSIVASTIIGQRCQKSFEYYYIDKTTQLYKDLKPLIEDWIELHNEVDPITMTQDPISRMPEITKAVATQMLDARYSQKNEINEARALKAMY